jgi:hypothetical protein
MAPCEPATAALAAARHGHVVAKSTADSLPVDKRSPLAADLAMPTARSFMCNYGGRPAFLPTIFIIDRDGILPCAQAGRGALSADSYSADTKPSSSKLLYVGTARSWLQQVKAMCDMSARVCSPIHVVGKLLTFSASGVWFDPKQEIILEGISQ